jgi:citrate lyase subunit alpha/citrate CoA-transferase
VGALVTPGKTVDVIVTEYGIAVNPERDDLREKMLAAKIPLFDIHELHKKAEELVGKPDPITYTGKVVGVVTYRDGSIIDLIYQVQ